MEVFFWAALFLVQLTLRFRSVERSSRSPLDCEALLPRTEESPAFRAGDLCVVASSDARLGREVQCKIKTIGYWEVKAGGFFAARPAFKCQSVPRYSARPQAQHRGNALYYPLWCDRSGAGQRADCRSCVNQGRLRASK